jgi:hypothetical protein
MITLSTKSGQFPSCPDIEGSDKADCGRDLVGRQRAAASFEDLGLDWLRVNAEIYRLIGFDDNVGSDDGARNRVPPGFDKRHLHLGVAVYDRLDLLGMDLLAADVNDSVPSADEVIPTFSHLDNIARIDKAVFVCERFAGTAQISERCSR